MKPQHKFQVASSKCQNNLSPLSVGLMPGNKRAEMKGKSNKEYKQTSKFPLISHTKTQRWVSWGNKSGLTVKSM